MEFERCGGRGKKYVSSGHPVCASMDAVSEAAVQAIHAFNALGEESSRNDTFGEGDLLSLPRSSVASVVLGEPATLYRRRMRAVFKGPKKLVGSNSLRSNENRSKRKSN